MAMVSICGGCATLPETDPHWKRPPTTAAESPSWKVLVTKKYTKLNYGLGEYHTSINHDKAIEEINKLAKIKVGEMGPIHPYCESEPEVEFSKSSTNGKHVYEIKIRVIKFKSFLRCTKEPLVPILTSLKIITTGQGDKYNHRFYANTEYKRKCWQINPFCEEKRNGEAILREFFYINSMIHLFDGNVAMVSESEK